MRKLLVVLLMFTAAQLSAQTKKVVITSASYYSAMGAGELTEMRAAAPGINLVAPDKAHLMAELADAEGVIGAINPDIMRAAPKLKWAQVTSAGVERFLTPELVKSNIVLTNCKIVQGPEIADHAFALLLSLTRQINRAVASRPKEEWPQQQYRPIELQGKTAVVVGVGGIGTQIAVRAQAFGMRVIGVDPRDMPYVPFIQKSVPPDRLDAVLPEADVVFVSAPHTPQTEKMFGERQFSRMKANAYFIAVSRGKLYDANALAAAIESKHLAGAGLDVTDPEPLPKGHALWRFENVVITPHVAGRSDGENARYLELFKENLRRFASGEPLLNIVDKHKGY